VVNKADLDGADRVVRDLRHMQALMAEHPPWLPPIVEAIAARSQGIDAVAAAVGQHQAFLQTDAGLRTRRRARARHVLDSVLRDLTTRALDAWLDAGGRREAYLDGILSRDTDPYSVGDEVLAALLRPCSPEQG
jgi:LAO/AO transport system kinase